MKDWESRLNTFREVYNAENCSRSELMAFRDSTYDSFRKLQKDERETEAKGFSYPFEETIIYYNHRLYHLNQEIRKLEDISNPDGREQELQISPAAKPHYEQTELF